MKTRKAKASIDTKPESPELPAARYVCMGARYENGELSVVLAAIDSEGDAGSDLSFPASKNSRRLRPGVIYGIEGTRTEDKVSLFLGSAQYDGRWPDESARGEWEAEHQVALLSDRAAKEPANPEMLKRLLPFRKAYAKAIGTTKRTTLELAILAALRTLPKAKEG